jgi:pimeloyl-ACP methyl ester carboxylesterase
MPETLQEQLVKHLADVHSIEEQALVQMRVAPRMARDPELALVPEAGHFIVDEKPGLVADRTLGFF